jgi:chloramphenicol 3-O-phosphotransferase
LSAFNNAATAQKSVHNQDVQKVLEVLQGAALHMVGVEGAREKVARKEPREKLSSVKHMEVADAASTLDAQRALKAAQISA